MIRVKTAEEGRAAAAVLAVAFAEDPILSWMLSEGRNTAKARRLLFGEAVRLGLRNGVIEMSDDRQSAALWERPERRAASGLGSILDPVRGALVALRAAGSNAPRLARLQDVIHAHRPQRPHWYLSAIGTAPEGRGRGGASSLLAARLAECDAQGEEAYLESSSPNNLPLYERHGFEILRQISVDDSPPLWLMLRPSHRGAPVD